MKKIVNILGVTGSIGKSTLSVLSQHPQRYQVGVVVGGGNWKKLAEIARITNAHTAVIADPGAFYELQEALSGSNTKVMAGGAAVIEAASMPSDITVLAISGFAGLKPAFAAMQGCKKLAIANKESIVCAGELMLAEAHSRGVVVIPVDSEHNALFQVFEQRNAPQVSKVAITASGGALRDYPADSLSEVTVEQALRHPNWNMGPKVTIDSATLANKGLEYIEASVLFPQLQGRVDVLIHPQSIIHGLVYYQDGSVLAHLAPPDMRVPIAHALAYPERIEIEHKVLDLVQYGALTFLSPDYERFPILKLAQESLKGGISARVCFNAANEVMVERFLRGECSFLDIQNRVADMMMKHNNIDLKTIDDIILHHEYLQSSKN